MRAVVGSENLPGEGDKFGAASGGGLRSITRARGGRAHGLAREGDEFGGGNGSDSEQSSVLHWCVVVFGFEFGYRAFQLYLY